MTVILYGIRNCDTMKKARAWLEAAGVGYRFHDYRADGVPVPQLKAWCDEHGWERLLNRSGTTWRRLDAPQREGLDQKRACALMREHPALIRRPVLDLGPRRLVGFDPAEYAAAFAPRR